MRWLLPILAGITLLLPTAANADELHLKDGSVVTGTVVGYEQDSFRVKTSWGYAEIRKDQVAQIVIGGGAVDESSATTSSTSSASTAQKSTAKKKSTATPPQISPSAPPAPVQSLPASGESQPVKVLVRAVVSSPNTSSVATENSAAAKLVATAPVHPAENAKSLPASVITTAPPADKLLVNSGGVVDEPGSNSPVNPATKPHGNAADKAASSASRAAAVAPVAGGMPAPGKAATPKVSADQINGSATPAAPPASVVKRAKLASSSPPAQSNAPAASRADGTASPAPPTKQTKAPPPAPEPVHETIVGNAYTNETYGIHMYRPPDWQLNADARRLMPGAIAALGTADEKTYFFIGLEPAHGVLAENLAEADKRLRGIMENYRAMGDRQVTISGAPATERRFRGTVDGRDWTGIVAVLPRANQLFTVFGITTSDSDLSGQIQENVIRRAIDSLAFTAVSPPH